MLTTTKRPVILLAVAFIGCTTAPDRGPTAPPSLAASGLQERVTGHANILLANLGNAEEKYSNNAIRHADGSVSGQFQLKTEQANGGNIHGSIVCFTITGNTARLAGLVEKSTTPLAPEGTYLVWTVVDNGEGKNDPPDATSDFFPTTLAGALFHCNVGFNLAPFFPVLGGNLQVHQ